MRHCGRGSGCTQHYLNYDAKVYNSSLPYCFTLHTGNLKHTYRSPHEVVHTLLAYHLPEYSDRQNTATKFVLCLAAVALTALPTAATTLAKITVNRTILSQHRTLLYKMQLWNKTQASCGRSNTLRTMRMTSWKCVLQQRHLLGYESEPER